MNRTILYQLGWRYLIRHRWQSFLMILGITLGVAVVVAIDLANASARRGFDLSTEAVAGRATHHITGGPTKIEETIYTQLKRNINPGAAAPAITEYVSSPQLGNRTLQLLGVDPFAEAPFRNYLSGEDGLVTEGLVSLLTQPGAVFISSDLAGEFGFENCVYDPLKMREPDLECEISIEVAGEERDAFIAGLLMPDDELSKRAAANILLMDIASAQEITGQEGLVDRIDLILDPDCSSTANGHSCPTGEQIRASLPPGAQLQTVEARTGAVEQMTAAFGLNLTALSLLALIVGMFLIYNTMTFSVVQRREHFGTLRCLGVTRREIFVLVCGEALVLGCLGAIAGAFSGMLMGQGAVQLVTQTINDLFFVLSVRGVQIPITSLVKGGLLGLVATIFSAAPPAWEAASVPPRMALTRSNLESKVGKAIGLASSVGVLLLISGTLMLLVPSRNLVLSFGATFAIIIGFSLIAPLTTKLIMKAAGSLIGSTLGILGRMAPRDVVNSLSRTAVAIAALMVAVSVTIGVSLMVSSFRHTVITWLEQTLQGDIYISAPGNASSQPSTPLDPQVVQTVRGRHGVSRADVLRSVMVDSPAGPIHVAATDNPSLVKERIYVSRQGSLEAIKEAMANGAIMVSEPLANRLGIQQPGETLTLRTALGDQDFRIVGIYHDYASTEGTVLMDLSTYRAFWKDDTLTAMSLRLDTGTDADQLANRLEAELQPIQRLQVRPNREVREEVLVVFDRTFLITGALQFLATVVAFIGILSALLSLQLERQRELGILCAIGMTRRQLWSLIMVETGLMGSVAGILAMPAGFVLAVILIFIINRRSFGWTLLMEVEASPFLQALLIAILAALLAGIYPAIKISKHLTAQALRSE